MTGRAGHRGGRNTQPAPRTAPKAPAQARQPPHLHGLVHPDALAGLGTDRGRGTQAAPAGPGAESGSQATAQPHSLSMQTHQTAATKAGNAKCKTTTRHSSLFEPNHHPARQLSPALDSTMGQGQARLGWLLAWAEGVTHPSHPTHHIPPTALNLCLRNVGAEQLDLHSRCSSAGLHSPGCGGCTGCRKLGAPRGLVEKGVRSQAPCK